MDIEKLIKRLKCPQIQSCPMDGEYLSCKACQKSIKQDAAAALSALQAENEKLRAELEQVKRERDAAVKDMAEMIGDIEEIRRGYGVDNADADSAFADLCGNYCANNGHFCYEESENYRCKHFKWRKDGLGGSEKE